jgi:hypothetical protein
MGRNRKRKTNMKRKRRNTKKLANLLSIDAWMWYKHVCWHVIDILVCDLEVLEWGCKENETYHRPYMILLVDWQYDQMN